MLARADLVHGDLFASHPAARPVSPAGRWRGRDCTISDVMPGEVGPGEALDALAGVAGLLFQLLLRVSSGSAGPPSSPTRPAGQSITRASTGRRYCSVSTILPSPVTAMTATASLPLLSLDELPAVALEHEDLRLRRRFFSAIPIRRATPAAPAAGRPPSTDATPVSFKPILRQAMSKSAAICSAKTPLPRPRTPHVASYSFPPRRSRMR